MVPDSSFYIPEESMTSGRSSFGEPQLEPNAIERTPRYHKLWALL